MRPLGPLALVLGTLLVSGSSAVATPSREIAVLRAEVRFAAVDGGASRLLIHGDLTAGPSLASFDPRVDPFRITVGPLVVLDGPPWPGGVRFRETRSGWRLDLPGAFGGVGRARVRLNPATGRFVVEARGFDGDALLAAGHAGVAVGLRAGEESYAGSVDFDARRPRRWVSLAPISGAPPPGGGGGGTPPAPGGFTTLTQGSQSGISAFRFEAIRDDATWASVWQQHAGSGPPPAVDFSTQMVLGVWLGARPTGGYTVDIVQVTPTPSGATAVIVESQPGWTPVAQVVTYPFHLVRLARVEGPVGYDLATNSQ